MSGYLFAHRQPQHMQPTGAQDLVALLHYDNAPLVGVTTRTGTYHHDPALRSPTTTTRPHHFALGPSRSPLSTLAIATQQRHYPIFVDGRQLLTALGATLRPQTPLPPTPQLRPPQ